MIRCLACGREFDAFAAFKRHEAHADHPDEGEVYC